MKPYQHTVQYYETDRMGITHHSNYIRWMEEARVDFLAQLGWNLERLEAMGAVSPVTALDVKYRHDTKFTGIRLRLHYVMRNPAGVVVFEGNSEHCFLDQEGHILRLPKAFPAFAQALSQMVEA